VDVTSSSHMVTIQPKPVATTSTDQRRPATAPIITDSSPVQVPSSTISLPPIAGSPTRRMAANGLNELSFQQLKEQKLERVRPSHTVRSSEKLELMLAEEEIKMSDLEGLDDGPRNLLGKGSFGEVRKVYWRKTPAAAKVAYDDVPLEKRQLLLRELELMVRCRHPNIVQFLGFVETPFIIVMEHVPMGDLRSYWKSRRVSVGHKMSISVDVLRALAYLHNRQPSKIIHRDVKPANVLITKSGVAKLTDFGLSRILGGDDSKHSGGAFYPACLYFEPATSTTPAVVSAGVDVAMPPAVALTAAGAKALSVSRKADGPWRLDGSDARDWTAVVGTAPYAAPESDTAIYDEMVDIYSAAVTFYEMFEQERFDDAMPFAYAMTPSKLRPLIKRMGSLKPEERPSALEAIDAFQEAKATRALGSCVLS